VPLKLTGAGDVEDEDEDDELLEMNIGPDGV
jgi:hypothetical protein